MMLCSSILGLPCARHVLNVRSSSSVDRSAARLLLRRRFFFAALVSTVFSLYSGIATYRSCCVDTDVQLLCCALLGCTAHHTALWRGSALLCCVHPSRNGTLHHTFPLKERMEAPYPKHCRLGSQCLCLKHRTPSTPLQALYGKHCTPTTIYLKQPCPLALHSEHGTPGTTPQGTIIKVPQPLYPKHCTPSTVPQALYPKHCTPSTVP